MCMQQKYGGATKAPSKSGLRARDCGVETERVCLGRWGQELSELHPTEEEAPSRWERAPHCPRHAVTGRHVPAV
jgi:hypothetical protein